MKSLIFKKKNLIAFAMAAVVAVAGFGAYRAQAAVKIDENEPCSITVRFENPANATGATDANKITSYNGDVEVDFYKLAEVKVNGDIGTPVSGVDLSALSNSNVDAAQVKKIAANAYEKVKDTKPDKTTTINPSKETKKSVDVNRGIYLYVVKDFQNNQYEYTFEKSIVMVPYSTTISQGTKVDENGNIVETTTSDEWIYNPEIALKYSVEEIYGSLVIEKELKTYNKSLGTTPFVFEVEASYDKGESKEIVYSNVFTMNFSEPGKQTVEVPNIPANSTVVVTEVYSGASYKEVVSADETHKVTIQKDVTAKTKFTNDYDNQTDVGAISIENHFNENGYVDSNINPNSTTTENVETEN
ncbi:hypothetical protein SAMN05216351_1047 [Pseudobutyrivibrio sp. JW11]|uniref:DUF5979 domain-containing protein n=1 Tax=Pseudobutyrivibrio sp. JW11 TaxID=1855302 RepID=UPI0008E93C24|nr:DUF5979 domain-containing protein [Pseudobutyrivibrio sp. JW11]SFO16719.1 hypothetical protein SAMN05216351_1047 [Pseudobutyrivibrio sp. JW11]